ncbi:MAG: ATP-binding protein [Fibrobacter sp.]|nr:ATP-binding protein [Fibrobacter sp.]
MISYETLENELAFCNYALNLRFDQYFSAEDDAKKNLRVEQIQLNDLSNDNSPYGLLVKKYSLGFDERFLLILALVPHLAPQMLDMFFLNNGTLGRPYTEFGGWQSKSHRGFLPTCETALFVLAGDNLERRLEVMRLFDNNNVLFKNHILTLEYGEPGEPANSAALRITPEMLEYILTGSQNKPDYSMHFPAKLITSKLTWDDLILNNDVMEDIQQIISWISHSDVILNNWGMNKNIKSGYRALFYGPPGTGKTLTATLIGSKMNMDVYRIDLSQVVSKYIGETEKNLSGIFDQAESHNWILFFDEADALFGARTHTNNANDRAANQEIAYLLQRIEDHPGVVILASNLKSNIDDAFARRFQSVIYFPMPNCEERESLWNNLFPEKSVLEDNIDFHRLAEKFELSGGALTNVARYAILRAIGNNRKKISHKDIELGISKELQKEGKSL